MRHRSLLFTSGLLALGVAAGVLRRAEARTASADIVLSDTEFAIANWTAHGVTAGSASQTAQQNAAGGNPGAWRLMLHLLSPDSAIVVWHIFTGPGATYDPGQQGPVSSLDFTLDEISISGKSIVGAFALTQNGRYYIARDHIFSATTWQRVQGTCLGAADFTSNDGGPAGSPDFSAAGGPIQFGFERANPVPSPAISGFFDHGIDNWSVTIHGQGAPCGVPTPTPTPTPTPVGSCPTLSFSPALLPNAVVGTPYRHTIAVDQSGYLFQGIADIPPGLTLDPDGVLSGVPTQLGTHDPVVRASGGIFCSADHTYHMVVGPCLIPPAPAGLAVDRATASPGDLYRLEWDPLSPLFGGHYDVLASVDGGTFQQIGITGTAAFTGVIPAAAIHTMAFQVKADWLCGAAAASFPSPSVSLAIIPRGPAGALVPLRQVGMQSVALLIDGRGEAFFAVDNPLLLQRLPDPLTFPQPDFLGSDPSEKGDIFYSDADGTPNPDGSFVTVESAYPASAPARGGLNVASVQLRFASRTEPANAVVSFAARGDSAETSTVGNAADLSSSSYAVLGNTNGGGPFARLRLTLGFPSSSPRPDLMVSIDGSGTGSDFRRDVTVHNVGTAAATGVTLDIGAEEAFNVSGGTLVCTQSLPLDTCRVDIGSVGAGATASVTYHVLNSTEGRHVKAADDGAHGPDADPGDNEASLPDGTFCAKEDDADDCNLCGVCTQILVCHGTPNSTAHTWVEAAKSLARGLRSVQAAGARLVLYYNFRDRFLRATPVGRRYIQLYVSHGGEVVQLLLADPTLRTLADSAMAAWEPALDVLLDGPGTNATFTQPMADTMTALLERMKQIGSAGLRADIAREQSLLDLASLVGKTLDDAHRSIDAQPCTATDTSLCLSGGRFRVEAAWKTPDGTAGFGHAAALTADTGTFWFFNPANVEMVAKILNGCGVDQRYWVFAGGLTNVEVLVTVTDTRTGSVRTYANPQGSAFLPIQDTAAFATCP